MNTPTPSSPGAPAYAHRLTGYANPAMAAWPRQADPATLLSLAGRTMGTTWSLRLHDPQLRPLDAVRHIVEAAQALVVAQMSTWEADSDISRFNHAPAGSLHTLPAAFGEVLDCALRWAERSDGAFDPTAGALVALWGFGAHVAHETHWPDVQHITHALACGGWQRLRMHWNAAAHRLCQPGGLWLDLSGIAKGFAVDSTVRALRAAGYNDFLLEIGGELRASGCRPHGQPWRIQINAAAGIAPLLTLRNMAIASSGDGWHVREADGHRWSHTIDPRSGLPVDNALSCVSVLHPQCMQADALATTLMVLGLEAGLAFAETHSVAALFTVRDGNGHRTHASTTWPPETA